MSAHRIMILVVALTSLGAAGISNAQASEHRATPPPLNTVLPPPPVSVLAPSDEPLLRPTPTTAIVDAVTLCMQAVTLGKDVNFTPLVSQGWRTQPTTSGQNSLGSFTLYPFVKGDTVIGVRNYQRAATCSVFSMSAGAEQLEEVSAALASSLGALPPDQFENLAAFREAMARDDPSGSRKFLFLPGQALEIEIAVSGGRKLLMITNSPFSLEQ